MKLLLLTSIISISFLCTSQVDYTSKMVTPVHTPTNIERYGVDYELKNYTFTSEDSTILNQLDLKQFEEFRNPSENIEINDPSSGLTIILFFEKHSSN